MPNKRIDSMRLPRELDKRVKLTDEDRAQIKALHEEGQSIRAIARMFEGKCSRRMIQFILFPERVDAMRANRDWRKYHDREKLTKAVADIRARKKELLENE